MASDVNGWSGVFGRLPVSLQPLTAVVLVLMVACTQPTPPVKKEARSPVAVRIDASGMDELWVRISQTDSAGRGMLWLQRDGSTVLRRVLSVADTLVHDTGLTVSTPYRYRAYCERSDGTVDSSAEVSGVTLAPTSHEFTLTVDTVGWGGNSILRDVAVINDTCAWVVGEIYMRDSTGGISTTPYGAAVWNGKTWKVLYLEVLAPPSNWQRPIRAHGIFAFSPTDIWFANSAVFHWDGTALQSYWISRYPGNPYAILGAGQSIETLWGRSSTDMYGAGPNGTLAHFDGSQWTKIEVPVTTELTGIWGSPDGGDVWVCGNRDFQPTVLLRGRGNTWEVVYQSTETFTIQEKSLSGALTRGWSNSRRWFFAASTLGLYVYYPDEGRTGPRKYFNYPYFPGWPYGLAAAGMNDIMLAGDYGMIAHYNGVDWRSYPPSPEGIITFHGASMRGNVMMAVGVLNDIINGKGIVVIGRR